MVAAQWVPFGVQTMGRSIGDVVPLVRIKRQPQQQLLRRCTRRKIRRNHRGYRCHARVCGPQRRHEAGGMTPRTLEVVGHHADLVDRGGHARPIDCRDVLCIRTACYGKRQPRPQGVHLPPELVQKGVEIVGMRLVRILPVHVDAGEDAAQLHAGRKMPVEKSRDAGSHKRHAILRSRSFLEQGLFAFDGDEHPQLWIARVQQFKLVQVAA